MKLALRLITLVSLVFVFTAQAQNRRNPVGKKNEPSPQVENSNTAIVVDERLAVLRIQPGFYSESIQRMRTGKLLSISASKQVDGLTYYRVVVPPRNYGWVQAEAVVGKNKKGDDERLVKLIQATDGFEKIERAIIFVENFSSSSLRPSILLLLGDLAEEAALKLTKDANKQLDKREMAASGAPIYSFFMNYVSLDRYRKLGIRYWFNASTRDYHYDGTFWDEINEKYPKSNEAIEAKKRLELLKTKMLDKGKF